jgi:hypothetical protein
MSGSATGTQSPARRVVVLDSGRPTAPDLSLDADVILAAQALTLGVPGVVVATSNAAHLRRYVPALPWRQIAP